MEDERLIREQQRGPLVSAPVSREPRSAINGRVMGSRVTLTPEQREFCKLSGMSEIDYAKGLIELQRRKALGGMQD